MTRLGCAVTSTSGGWSSTVAPEPPATTADGPTVEYDVGGNGHVTVTYEDTTGETVSKTVEPPWYDTVPTYHPQSVHISAVQQGNGIVTCSIFYERRRIADESAHGDHAVVTCQATR